MASSLSRRGRRWLRGELPALVAAGVISEENARAIERHYAAQETHSTSFAFVLLASVGSALVAAGFILLIAHNWDHFSRPLRSVFAFLPLLAAQALTAWVLLRRDQSQPWRESAAIFNVAAIGTAISIVSQTYQITGSLAGFILVWMLLSLPLIYLLRTSLGALAYGSGAALWVIMIPEPPRSNPLYFWLLLLGIAPWLGFLFRQRRESWETALVALTVAVAAAIGLGYTAGFAQANLGVLAYAGLFALVYLVGIQFFRITESGLHPLAFLGGLAIGFMTILLTFQEFWNYTGLVRWPSDSARLLAALLLLAFPLGAGVLGAWILAKKKLRFSVLAAAFPVVVAIAWLVIGNCRETRDSPCQLAASILLNLYALGLGIELIARGLRAGSLSRANFGLGVIAALATARFFDSDLTFVARAIGFIVIGLGFLGTNLLLFRKRSVAPSAAPVS